MKERLLDIALGLIAGLLLAWGAGTVCYDNRLKAVQDYAKAVSDSSREQVVQVQRYAALQRRRADSLEHARQPIIRQAVQDTALANLAERSLANARTVRDTNVALRLENQALRKVVVNLWTALAESDTIISLERARGDSLNKVLGDVNLRLQSLASQIEGLKPAPKWIRVSAEIVKDIVLVRVGYEYCKHSCH